MTRDEDLDAVYNEVTANDTCIEDSVTSLLEEIVRLREEKDAVFDNLFRTEQQRDELLHELSLSRLANEEQDKRLSAVEFANTKVTQRLAAVEAERDAMESMYRHHVAVSLDAIAKLNRTEAILAALRKPSEAVVIAAENAMDTASATDCVPGDWNTAWVLDAIRAAVAAAEKEASDA